MAGTAPQIRSMTTDEERIISVDMSAMLDADEILVGDPDIQSTDDLFVEEAYINDDDVEINDVLVPVGKAVQFKASSTITGSYVVEIVCATNGGQTVEGRLRLSVEQSRY